MHERKQVVDPALDVRLAHPHLHLLVEERVHVGIGSEAPAYTPINESVPPRRTVSIAVVQDGEAVDAGLLHQLTRATASGRNPVSVCAAFANGEPCASIPTASITESGPRPSVQLADRVGTSPL